MFTSRHALVAAVALLVCTGSVLSAPATSQPSSGGPEAATAEQITALVKALDAENAAERQKAAEKLVDLGERARPSLEKLLADEGELSPQQASRVRDVLIDDGAIVRLEKSSKLDEDQLASLHELRTELIKRNDSHRAGNDLTKAVQEEEMSDEALALLVYSLARQVPTQDNNSRGFEPYVLSNVFQAIIAKPTAGDATGRAFGAWVREYIIPSAFPTEEGGSPRMNDWQGMQLARKLLTQDRLDAVTYDALVTAMCRQMSGGSRGYGGSDLGLSMQTIIPICYGRHCRPEHIGRIVQAIISESLTKAPGGWSNGSQCLEYVIGSPHLTEGHARALIDWMVSSISGLQWMDQRNLESLGQLTGQTFVSAADMKAFYQSFFGEKGPDPLDLVQSRIKAWWDEHQGKPILSAPPSPRYRYVLVEITKEDEDAKLNVLRDVPLRPGVGMFFRDASTPDRYEFVCQLTVPSPTSTWIIDREQLYPGGVEVKEYQAAENSTTTGSKVYIPGEPQFVLATSRNEAGKQVEVFRAALLLPIDQPLVSDGQLRQPQFWVERIVRSAAEFVVRSSKIGPGQMAVVNESGQFKTNPLSLQPYRAPGMEAEVRKLLDHADPTVKASAALLLARWQADFDAATVRPLLQSKEEKLALTAAEALGSIGDAEGMKALIERSKDPLRAGPAARVLIQTAKSPKIEAAAKQRHAANIVRALLPKEQQAHTACLTGVLVAKAWTGEDYGYEPGGDPVKNNAALKRYHDWADAQKR